MYDKLLITNNPLIEKSPYFDKKRMFVFKDVEEIENMCIDFVEKVSYNYQGEFSPLRLLERIVSVSS